MTAIEIAETEATESNITIGKVGAESEAMGPYHSTKILSKKQEEHTRCVSRRYARHRNLKLETKVHRMGSCAIPYRKWVEVGWGKKWNKHVV